MPLRRLSTTMISFLVLFSGGAMLVLLWVTLESLFIKRLTFSYLLRFSIPATLVILLGMVGVLMFYVYLRLSRLKHISMKIEEEAGAGEYHDHEDRICRSLLRLPSELFWGTVAYGGLFIPVYHIVHYLVEGHSLTRVEEFYWLNFLRSFLYEQTIALSAAILHYAVARRLIRPMLMRLKRVRGERWADKSFLSMLTTTFAGLLLVNLFSILWYVMVAVVKEESIELKVLAPLIVLDSAFAASIFVLLAIEFRRELQVLIGSIRDWLNSDRSLPNSRMPILSHDEVGQLAIVFNRLQDQVNQEYEELKKDMQLARQVQLQLLPIPSQAFGEYEIRAITESHTVVGNGFYDIMAYGDNGFAAIAGAIMGSGMPAALHMSAALLLLRAEIEQDHVSPEQMLIRFDQGMNEVFPQGDPVSLVIILVDIHRNVLRAVLQGRMNISRIRDGRLEKLSPGVETPFHSGDQWLLYSDPAMEAAEAIAHEHIQVTDSQLPFVERLRPWSNRFTHNNSSMHEDFTLLLITRRGVGVGSE